MLFESGSWIATWTGKEIFVGSTSIVFDGFVLFNLRRKENNILTEESSGNLSIHIEFNCVVCDFRTVTLMS